MPYQIFHIFTKQVNREAEKRYTVKNSLLTKSLIRLGIIKEISAEASNVSFSYSFVSPVKIQEIIKDQVAHLRSTKLEPMCIFIGSKDYTELCEYADLSLIQQFSYIESVRILEEIKQAAPLSSTDQKVNGKVFELLINQNHGLINQKIQRIPGSLIVSGYRFLDLPLIILPWLSGVFVAPDLSQDVEPNTTII